MEAHELWEMYCKEKNIEVANKYDAWAFCGGGPSADVLLKLVLEGKKFATASLYEDYVADNEPIPSESCYSVILDSQNQAVCVIRNFECKVEPFYRVTDYHGYAEGEEERNLNAWRRIHEQFWKNDMQRLNIQSMHDMHIVQEKFTVEFVAPGYNCSSIDEECYLVEPTLRYEKQIEEYRKEMLAVNSSFDGCGPLSKSEDIKQWIEKMYECGNPSKILEDEQFLITQLLCIRKKDDRLVGMVQIRVIPNESNAYPLGQIGYSVLPSLRNNGYATFMLKKALKFLKYGKGVNKAELSIVEGNIASEKVILKCGGYYRDKIKITKNEKEIMLHRYYIDLDYIE